MGAQAQRCHSRTQGAWSLVLTGAMKKEAEMSMEPDQVNAHSTGERLRRDGQWDRKTAHRPTVCHLISDHNRSTSGRGNTA